MNNYEQKINLERNLEKFQIEKSIEGTEAFHIQKDIEAGLSQHEILQKSQTGFYQNDGVFKSNYDDLEKSMKPDDVIRGIEDFKITKSGKEIKTALENGMKEINIMKDKCYLDLIAMRKEIGEEPTKDFCESHNYMCEGYKTRLEVPKVYDMSSGEKIKPVNETVLYADGSTQGKVNPETQQAKWQYNDKVYTYCRICIDILKMQTVIDGINEKKTYRLAANVATKLNL